MVERAAMVAEVAMAAAAAVAGARVVLRTAMDTAVVCLLCLIQY